ncbi:lipopolysaccharide biosynthesis protein [Flavobacterium sp.]|uniref:lipopolysaccharide biosynthesis protein n=1 Tax=Flavobacterium sp. TaxID=239 RepID=UPI0039E30B0A
MKLGGGILGKKKIKDLMVYGFGQAINLLSPLIVMPYLIHICGEEGLGKIGVGFSMALILNGIVDYGSYIKGVKDISINRDNHEYLAGRFKAIYLSKFLLLLAVLGVMTLVFFIVPFFARDKELFFLSLFMVLGQFINPAWFFQGTENFKWISLINILFESHLRVRRFCADQP